MTEGRRLDLVAALRRKLRALTAVQRDAGATPQERANAASLKKRLERRLRESGTPAGDWTDHAFRLGRWVQGVRRSGPLASQNPKSGGAQPGEPQPGEPQPGEPMPSEPKPGDGDWTDQARQLGKFVGRGYRKFLSR